uniref:SoHo domain-containing protein n=1 Tax=Zeugodacus cucurbitae TaxID=28588 RepID=A0A0A1XFW6_ZEUCU
MPNYRQKNKRNKNKNRQKNQQQQQQNKNQNQQQPEIQQTHQNRQPNDNKDNQSQGHSRREQSNQQQQRQQHPKTPPKSPKSPTPTATQHTPPADEPRTATSPQQQQPASSEDAREVDSNVPAAALNQCHNLNSNEPTTRDSHQTFTTAVEREECNRVEDADAQLSKLDNTEAATHSDTAYLNSATVVGVERDAVYRSTMGNKDSKTYITSSNDVATTARTETVTTSTDLCGISRPDRTIAGARELDELHTVMPKTQMAKVIVHRIVRETSTEGGDNEQRRNGDIDKVEQVVNVGASMTSGTTGESKVEVMNEPKIQATSSDGQIEESELHEQLQSTVKEGNEVGSKVIVHKIEQEPGEEPKAELTKVEPKVIVHEIKQVEDDLTVSQESEALTAQTTDQTSQINANVIVHKIAQSTDGNAVASRIQDNGAEKPTVSPPTNAACVSPTGMPEQNDDAKVIIHHIQLESTSPINYRVDSPDTDSPTTQLCRSKRQQLLNKSIVQIQELSDESSSEYNDNPPVISEAESETESMAGACALDYAQAVRTLSPDSDDNFEILRKPPTIPSQEQQDLKQRRAQKRVALETHFLPQLLSPRYLDSIIEENSDMSDARSDCSENPLMTTQSGDDLHDASASKVRKANEVFPRSNLDFTRRHAKKPLGALPKKPLPIREEPVAMVVAAKLIDNALTPAQECCTRLSSEHTPESEAAEVIYLSSSASSSLSDLMELDTEGDGDDECGNSSRSTIDLDTDAREIITRPDSEECATTASDSRESTPVNQASTSLSENNETQKFHANNNNNESGSVEQITATAAAAAVNGTNIDTAKITNPIEQRIFENLKSLQLLAEPSGERTLSNGSGEIKTSTTTRVSKRTTTTISETERSSETTTERCEYLRSSNSSANGSGSSSLTSSTDAKYPPAIIATSDSLNVDPAVLLENIELEMNSVRDILNSHTIETTETTATTCGNQHVSDTRTTCELKNIDNFNSAKNSSLSPPPIPPPPTSASASDFHSDFTGFQTQPIQPPPVPARATQDTGTLNSASTLTTTTEQKCAQSETTNTLSPNTHNALTSLSLLARQESAESHCSDSTQHSQCTAINVGSRPSTDHELTPPLTATSPISDASQQQQQRQHTTEWKYGETSESDANSCDLELPNAQQKDASIKKLRLLCTETLASMPYGEQVLVELATVAQNIGELQAKPPTQVQPEKISPLSQGKTGEPNMPYPLPQLPHISELQLSIADERSAPTTHSEPKRGAQVSHTPTTHIVPITQLGDPVGAPRDLTAASAKLLHSPPPPPVPAPPARYSDAPWLGLPTAADPNVLVCLSPAQQQQLTGNNTQSASQTGGAQQTTPQPDQLLDAHQKFLERRGYHEYTDEQVKSLNAEMQQEEQQILKTAAYMKKLRKSLTPPPPPVPPPPVPAKNAETAAKAQNQARTAAAASTSYVSSGHSQRVYDVIQDRNANEQIAGTFANGEQQQQQHQANQSEQKRLLTLIQQHADAPADAFAVSVDGSSSATSSAHQQTSSLENNSRQTSAAAVAAATAAAQGGAPTFAGKQTTDTRQYSNANASESTSISRVSDLYAANNYTKNSFPTTTTASTSSVNMQGVESELAKMFPSMGSSDIFDSNRKRFSNIESSTTAKDGTYCAQLQSTLPKRYSNIETHSYEAKKRMENGQVIYDYSNSRHERQSDGDKSLENASTPSLLHFPVREPSKESLQYPVAGDGVSNRSGNSEIMSAIKLNTTENAKTTTQETKLETKEQSNGINMTNFAHPGATSTATATSTTATPQHNPTDRTFGTAATTATTETTIKEEHIKNSQEFGSGTAQPQASSGGGVSGSAYEEFRQRAKAAAFGGETPATAPPLGESNSKHSAFNFQHDKLFKDFDALSQQLHMELEEGKAQRQQREKSASLFDLNRTQWNFKDHFDELKQQRHEHMQELEREIERSMRSRQLKGWANGGAPNTANATPAGRTYEIPIQIEQNNGNYSNGYARKADRSSAPRELTQPRSYNIPIVLENGDAPAVPPPPTADYDTVDDASRFRRAESMFNLSNDTRRTQTQSQQTYATYERPKSAAADDWARYASDFGSSENITRPFAREVEICYQRQRPRTIRAPRLSASTNDLSSYTHSYDNYNAYNARRTQAPMLQPVSQQQRPHHGSCYSVLERNPNPTYISTTTRRGVSPAPVSPNPQAAAAQEPLYSPHAPERQRRASLPREIQEQQLKYISSKEEELRMEFERLQNERRRLMDELNTPTTPTLQMPQHPMRDIYRPVPKLPTLTEDEVFRQQMAEEWLSKVAEREERRLHKIIKISKVNETQQGQQPPVPPHPKTDISDEFLKRVQERRTKLAMPADSDWESGAESQPVKAGHASESDAEVPPVKVIEGKSETDLRQLPRHLREFARFSNHNEEKIDGGHRVVHQEEERRQEANGNSMSSALKKSSVVKTVKIARQPEIVTNISQRVAPPVSVQQQQQHQNTQQQQGHSRTTSGGETVDADETAPFTTTPPPPQPPHSPFFSKLPVSPSFDEMFATSPFKSRIYDEFERFWRSFDHTT